MRYLIVDVNISLDGHKLGFMQSTLNYLVEKNTTNSFVFFANASSDFKLKIISNHKNITLKYLSAEETEQIKIQTRTLTKAHTQWNIIKETAIKHAVDHVIMMDIDLYQLSIGISKTPFKISGIWFRPFLRLQPNDTSLKASFRLKILKIQKKISLKVALLNSNIHKIFVLNDETMPAAMVGFTNKLFYLPDPIFPYIQEPSFDLRQKYGIAKDTLIFLQFGFIDNRKNNQNILAALRLLPKDIAEKTCFLVIGKFEDQYEDKIHSWAGEKPVFQICLRNEYVSDTEMESTFAQSDVILRMNDNFAGSSGIVGIAASHNKPCIVSNFGVMADQVAKYKLGLIIDPKDPDAISKGILSFYTKETPLIVDGAAYRSSHSVQAFVETLLS